MAVVRALWKALGMRTIRVGPAEHDRWVATISHLPHAAATCLVATAAAQHAAWPAIASGFMDTTRIASSDLAMWTDIFLTNRRAAGAAIERYVRRLAGFRKAVLAGDERAIAQHLRAARRARDEMLSRRGGA